MTPHHQLGQSDCVRTCIACVFDVHPSEVPDTSGPFANWGEQQEVVTDWLKARGYALVNIAFRATVAHVLEQSEDWNPGLRYFLSASTGTGFDHMVICKDGRIEWDPSPVSGPLMPTSTGLIWVHYLTPLI